MVGPEWIWVVVWTAALVAVVVVALRLLPLLVMPFWWQKNDQE